jgi:hypothetical protein
MKNIRKKPPKCFFKGDALMGGTLTSPRPYPPFLPYQFTLHGINISNNITHSQQNGGFKPISLEAHGIWKSEIKKRELII